MANTKFTQAVKKAKSLYKTGRYKTFADAVKSAYKGKKASKKTKIVRKSKVAKKTAAPANKKRHSLSSAQLRSELKSRVKESLSKQLLRRELATTKRDKRQLTKQIRQTKSELRRIG